MDSKGDIPDFTDEAHVSDWRFQSWEKAEELLRDNLKKPDVHPVDPISIALKDTPIPVKDLDEDFLSEMSYGWYAGDSIRKALLDQEFETLIDGHKETVSRWAMFHVNEILRVKDNLKKAELRAQNDMRHGQAQVRGKEPYKFGKTKDGKQIPIIGVRVFHGGPQQALNEYVYYIHYGFMRCNLAQDSTLQEGVYAWTDINLALKGIELHKATDRMKCIGIVEGYLSKRDGDKISLNPRSTKLLAIFAPWDEDVHLPFELGAEDTLAFRLPPHQVGAPVRWFRQLYCIDGTRYTKGAIRGMIDSGDWPTPITETLLDECAENAEFNIASLNVEDMMEQKRLYIKMMEEPTEYKDGASKFALTLTHTSLMHGSQLPLCLQKGCLH